jgi:AraC family transcriptional regulator
LWFAVHGETIIRLAADARYVCKESLMKRSLGIGFLVVGVAMLIGIACAEKAQEKKSYEIRVKNTDAMTLVYLEHIGPYDRMGDVFARVGDYAAKKGLTGDIVGIYFDDPTQVPAERLKARVGITVPQGTAPDSGFGVEEIPAQEVVYAIMKGPYDEIAKEYPHIMEWTQERGYQMSGPLMEIYLEAGPDIPPEQLVTEVRIPIKK